MAEKKQDKKADVLQKYLDMLDNEVVDSKEKRTAIETLITIYRNILKDSDNEKYKKLNKLNPLFNDKVWKFQGVRQFMKNTGWQEVGSELFFISNCMCLHRVINLLLDNRLMAPAEDEWVEENKYEGKSAEQLREENLRRKAITERNKEIEEYLKDKKYRENLAKEVLKEHRADRHKRQFHTAQIGNKLKNDL